MHIGAAKNVGKTSIIVVECTAVRDRVLFVTHQGIWHIEIKRDSKNCKSFTFGFAAVCVSYNAYC